MNDKLIFLAFASPFVAISISLFITGNLVFAMFPLFAMIILSIPFGGFVYAEPQVKEHT